MNNQIIFIHSAGFRTGSTYFWSKFREKENVRAYYEPFHENLKNVKLKDLESTFQIKNHPKDLASYHNEFKVVRKAEGGIKNYKPEFAFHNNFRFQDEMIIYINNLIKAGNNYPKIVFGFNRSAGRIRGFTEKFDAFNIYLHRNLQDQWVSIATSEINESIYRHIFNLNHNDLIFIPFIKNGNLSIKDSDCNYFLFYYIHKIYDKIGYKYADYMIKIDDQSNNTAYKIRLKKEIKKYTDIEIDFHDLKAKSYSNEIRRKYCSKEIEETVDEILTDFDDTWI